VGRANIQSQGEDESCSVAHQRWSSTASVAQGEGCCEAPAARAETFLAIGLHRGALKEFDCSLSSRAYAITFFASDWAMPLRQRGIPFWIGGVHMDSGVALGLASALFALITMDWQAPARRSVVVGFLVSYCLLQCARV